MSRAALIIGRRDGHNQSDDSFIDEIPIVIVVGVPPATGKASCSTTPSPLLWAVTRANAPLAAGSKVWSSPQAVVNTARTGTRCGFHRSPSLSPNPGERAVHMSVDFPRLMYFQFSRNKYNVREQTEPKSSG